MRNFENSERSEQMSLAVDGTRVVLEQQDTDIGVTLRFVEGLVREVDEPGQEELVVLSEDVTSLNPEGDMEQSGLGSEVVEKDGVTIHLGEGVVSGPDIETVKSVLEEIEFGYANPYDV